jgi:hypothetical protein
MTHSLTYVLKMRGLRQFRGATLVLTTCVRSYLTYGPAECRENDFKGKQHIHTTVRYKSY